MLIVKHSHQQYQNFVHEFLTHHFISTGQHITLFTRAPLILKLWPADLTGIVDLLKSRYAKSNRGTPPYRLLGFYMIFVDTQIILGGDILFKVH